MCFFSRSLMNAASDAGAGRAGALPRGGGDAGGAGGGFGTTGGDAGSLVDRFLRLLAPRSAAAGRLLAVGWGLPLLVALLSTLVPLLSAFTGSSGFAPA